MSKLSGIKDVDREILDKLDDRSLLQMCMIDKYTWNSVCDDAFLRRRILRKFPNIGQYKKSEETWKRFFLRAIKYISLLKEFFDYDYEFGNFKTQYKILKSFFKKQKEDRFIDDLMMNSAGRGELSLVIWSLKHGADIHSQNDYVLVYASQTGKLEVVKFLVEKSNIDVRSNNGLALSFAISNGHLEVVKYLVEHGAYIQDKDLQNAVEKGHLDVVKYLESKKI